MYKELSKKKRDIQQNQFVTNINLSLESTIIYAYMIRDLKTVQSTISLFYLWQIMKKNNIGSVIEVDESLSPIVIY